jgi:hypothetical protein
MKNALNKDNVYYIWYNGRQIMIRYDFYSGEWYGMVC